MTIPEIPDISGLHPFIDQQMVKNMWANFHAPDSGWGTTINIDYEQNPLHHAKTVFKWSDAQINEVWKALGWGIPYPSPPSQPKLSVSGGVLYCGNKKFKGAGASSRLALLDKTGEHGFGPWPPDYQFEDYIQDIKDSGINYVRHIGSMDFDFLKAHCQEMKDNNIVVEVEVYDPALLDFPFVDISRMGELSELGNVLINPGNEFRDDASQVNIVLDICEDLTNQGCIVGSGAWSDPGEPLSELFFSSNPKISYSTHHRHWVEAHWKKTIAYGFPTMANEIFNLTGMSLTDVSLLMSQAFQAGCQGVQYYCWFGPPDILAFKDVLEVCKNQLI